MAQKTRMLSNLYPFLLAALVLNCYCDERKVVFKMLSSFQPNSWLYILFIIFYMQLHIIYMGDLPEGDLSVASTHHSMLQTVLGRLSYHSKIITNS